MPLFLTLQFILLSTPQPLSHIQVVCEPGVQIFLDKTFIGVTTKTTGGLIIQGIAPGQHTIRAVKPGYLPNERVLHLKAGQVLVHEINRFIPDITISEEGMTTSTIVEAAVGTLIVQSLPIDCAITISSVNVLSEEKTKDRWKIANLPTGHHRIEFVRNGKTLFYDIDLRPGEELRLFVNFLSGKVSSYSSIEEELARAKHEQQRKKQEALADSGTLVITFKERCPSDYVIVQIHGTSCPEFTHGIKIAPPLQSTMFYVRLSSGEYKMGGNSQRCDSVLPWVSDIPFSITRDHVSTLEVGSEGSWSFSLKPETKDKWKPKVLKVRDGQARHFLSKDCRNVP